MIVAKSEFFQTKPNTEEVSSLEKKIDLLSDYITHLREMDTTSQTRDSDHDNIYHMPSEQVSAEEWADFENVYQIHSPKLFLTVCVIQPSYFPSLNGLHRMLLEM